MATTSDELKQSLERHNSEFEALLRLIPAKYYLVPDDSGEQASKYQKNKKKQKQAEKAAQKEAAKKAKREKLDPANNKSIVEIQEETLRRNAELSAAASKKKGKRKAEESESEDDASAIDDENAMDVDGTMTTELKEESSKQPEFKSMEASVGIEALRAKLRARIEESRRKKGPKVGSDGGASSKDELLEERRQQRALMRERRRKETKEKKRREEEEKAKKGKGKEKQTTAGTSQNKTQLIVPDVSTQLPSAAASQYTNITFSNLSGSKPGISKSLKTASNPAQALEQLQKRAEARSALPSEKQKELAEKDAWAKAGARVTGEKVHDDTSRLQKAAKRREKEKQKSKKAWDTRKEQLTASQAAKQKKRTDNIAMRNERRKSGGKGKAEKKRPGFEGKSFGGGGGRGAAKSAKKTGK